MSLSPAATVVLTRAAERPDHRLELDRKLPAGGRQRMIDSLLRSGMVAEIDGPADATPAAATGLILTSLMLTDAGFVAIGRARPVPTISEEAQAVVDAADASNNTQPRSAARDSRLARAAQAALEAYKAADDTALSHAMDDLANALTAHPKAVTATTRAPRQGTKQQTVLDLLRRPDGATITQIIDATGWQSHTVRGFLAGLKKKGFTIEVLERVRQVGPNKEGARGSYSIYRIAT